MVNELTSAYYLEALAAGVDVWGRTRRESRENGGRSGFRRRLSRDFAILEGFWKVASNLSLLLPSCGER